MLKVTIVLGAILVMFIAESTCQKFILPTFRPPRRKPVIRHVRDVSDLTPIAPEGVPVTLLHEEEFLDRTARSLDSPSAKRGGGSHSTSTGSRDTGATHPGYNRRNARSLDSPSAKRGSGSPRTSSGSRNTGPTHPGYNRRNAREIRLPGHLNPLRPKPLFPRPSLPQPVPQFPIYARTTRDIPNPSFRKPNHSDAIMHNWNPYVKTNPGRQRHERSIDMTEEFEVLPHERVARDVQISGLPRKPTHRDVIIPNWNPHVKTNPWDSLGGKGRHGRSIDMTEDLDNLPHGRVAREVQISGLPRKPTHRDVIIPNWNPHVKTNPWNSLGGRGSHH